MADISTKYVEAVEVIKTAILTGQYEAAGNVNRVQLLTYFSVGKYLSINTRLNKWGNGVLEAISSLLKKELPGLRGFSPTQLKEMRSFYEGWIMLDPNSSVATDGCIDNTISAIHINNASDFPIDDFFRVPFSHHTRILAMEKNPQARYYYIHRTAEEHLSVENLKKLIKQNAYEHRGSLPNNFSNTISGSRAARKAVDMFKDEYLLNFINVEEIGTRDNIDVDERVIEQEIIHNIKNFIMTFGRNFAFVGNQYHLEAYGVEYFPDLLFFNRELNALVVVELKTGDFKTSYLGQLMGYLRILDDHVKKPHENPSIGIVLCKTANKDFVEYVIQDYNKPMGVSTYSTSNDLPDNLRNALPNMEELRKLL